MNLGERIIDTEQLPIPGRLAEQAPAGREAGRTDGR